MNYRTFFCFWFSLKNLLIKAHRIILISISMPPDPLAWYRLCVIRVLTKGWRGAAHPPLWPQFCFRRGFNKQKCFDPLTTTTPLKFEIAKTLWYCNASAPPPHSKSSFYATDDIVYNNILCIIVKLVMYLYACTCTVHIISLILLKLAVVGQGWLTRYCCMTLRANWRGISSCICGVINIKTSTLAVSCLV